MDSARRRDIERCITSDGMQWDARAKQIAIDLLNEVRSVETENCHLQSIAFAGWLEAWHCGNGFMALPPDDDHATVQRCWAESETLKRLQSVNGKTLAIQTKNLICRAVSGLKHIGTFPPSTEPHPLDCTLAGRVSHVFGVGMTRAIQLCKECGEDPGFTQTLGQREVDSSMVTSHPERTEGSDPQCPHCGLVHEMPTWVETYHRFDCDCGWRLEAERTQVIVTRAVEYRE